MDFSVIAQNLVYITLVALFVLIGILLIVLIFVGIPYYAGLVRDEIIEVIENNRLRRSEVGDDDNLFTEMVEEKKERTTGVNSTDAKDAWFDSLDNIYAGI